MSLPQPETMKWMETLSTAELVDVLHGAGRVYHEDKDYWLALLSGIRSKALEEAAALCEKSPWKWNKGEYFADEIRNLRKISDDH